jgi:EAL domain-containing protein (putative c-di-GMP-specific phosphodiesterase class I)
VGSDPLDALLRPGTLEIALQPVVELTVRGSVLWSVECLARGPAGTPFADSHEMFEYVRRRGAEIRMDRACFREAVRAVRALPGSPRCSVNVHARTLADDGRFPAFVLEELRQARLSPRRFTLEVTAPRDLTPALLEAVAQLRSVASRSASTTSASRTSTTRGCASASPTTSRSTAASCAAPRRICAR